MAESFRDEVHNIVNVIYPDIQAKFEEFSNANISSIASSLLGKVDKIIGKDLSENDFTAIYKDKLDGLSLHPTKHPVYIIDGTSNPSKFVKTDAVGNTGFDDVTWNDIQGKPTSFIPFVHQHELTDINGISNKADKTYVDTSILGLQSVSQLGKANGYVPLDSSGKISNTYLNSLSTIEVFTASSQANMLLLSNVGVGDQCIRTDLSSNQNFILTQTPSSDLANWTQLLSSASIVSVNGQTGVVSLTANDIGLGNVSNTSDVNKPISTATQSALNLKVDSSSLSTALSTKQDTLVSATNIKTVNGNSILGSGDLVISAGAGDMLKATYDTNLNGVVDKAEMLNTARNINGVSFNGSTDINIEARLGTTIASATTTTIGTVGNGEEIHISGTTTITSLGVSQTGVFRTLVFDGALILTYNATSLMLPTSANITTVAGDSAEFICENGALGYWRCTNYCRRSGVPLTLGSLSTTGSAATLTTARTINGVSFNGSANINIEARIGTIASAATTTIGTAGLSESLHVTGTTTITSLGTATTAGIMRTLIFDGILTLTHNATSLILLDGTNITTAVGDSAEFVCDTTNNWKLLRYTRAITPTIKVTPEVRQTVLKGNVDTSGFSAFGGSTGSTTVTTSSTLVATCADGTNDRIGTIVNPSWTGLSTNGTMYLYLDIATDGTCTTGSTTLVPTYRWGGADVVTNLQNTFNIQEMKMKVGNGSTASQVYRVFVGEVTIAGAVVSTITWYALMGRHQGTFTNTLPAVATLITQNHNIGLVPDIVKFEMKCLTADSGYAVGDVVTNVSAMTNAGVYMALNTFATAKTLGFTTGANAWAILVINKGTGAASGIVSANWAYRMTAQRGW